MSTATPKRLHAFKGGPVNAKPGPSVFGHFPTIVVTTSGNECGQLNCLQWEPPRAWVNPGETIVHVDSSAGLPGGFDVACETECEAQQIAVTLSAYLSAVHARLFQTQNP